MSDIIYPRAHLNKYEWNYHWFQGNTQLKIFLVEYAKDDYLGANLEYFMDN